MFLVVYLGGTDNNPLYNITVEKLLRREDLVFLLVNVLLISVAEGFLQLKTTFSVLSPTQLALPYIRWFQQPMDHDT